MWEYECLHFYQRITLTKKCLGPRTFINFVHLSENKIVIILLIKRGAIGNRIWDTFIDSHLTFLYFNYFLLFFRQSIIIFF